MKRMDSAATAAKVAAELATGKATGPSQIARNIGVSRQTVHRHLKSIRPALAELEAKKAAYRAQVEAKTPSEARAERLGELVRQPEQPMVALKAIMYADRVCGVGPAEEMREVAPSQPLFNLPAGSRVAVAVE